MSKTEIDDNNKFNPHLIEINNRYLRIIFPDKKSNTSIYLYTLALSEFALVWLGSIRIDAKKLRTDSNTAYY